MWLRAQIKNRFLKFRWIQITCIARYAGKAELRGLVLMLISFRLFVIKYWIWTAQINWRSHPTLQKHSVIVSTNGEKQLRWKDWPCRLQQVSVTVLPFWMLHWSKATLLRISAWWFPEVDLPHRISNLMSSHLLLVQDCCHFCLGSCPLIAFSFVLSRTVSFVLTAIEAVSASQQDFYAGDVHRSM